MVCEDGFGGRLTALDAGERRLRVCGGSRSSSFSLDNTSEMGRLVEDIESQICGKSVTSDG